MRGETLSGCRFLCRAYTQEALIVVWQFLRERLFHSFSFTADFKTQLSISPGEHLHPCHEANAGSCLHHNLQPALLHNVQQFEGGAGGFLLADFPFLNGR